jgi:hypothetical protein
VQLSNCLPRPSCFPITHSRHALCFTFPEAGSRDPAAIHIWEG